MQNLLAQKMTITVVLACAAAFAPLAYVKAASSTTTAATSSAPAPSLGTSELKREIAAQKARVTQLTKIAKPASGIARVLQRGSSGKDVRLLQDFLKLYGIFPTSTVSSGFFGPQTMHAVKEFQRKESIDPIGVVGPKTQARIRALSAHELVQAGAHAASSSAALAPSISEVIFSSDVGEDGSGVGSSTVFASTTPNIYAILTLANARQDTTIGFIRSYNSTYVDSAVTHPSRSGLRYLHVQWSLKSSAHRVPGTYTIVWYVDGERAKSATFTIK